MKNKSKKLSWITSAFVLSLTGCVFLFLRASVTVSIALLLAVIISGLLGVFAIVNYVPSLYKISSIALACLLFVICGYLILIYTNSIEIINNPDKLKALLSSTGGWAEIVFVLISFAQVTLIPIPSTITVMAGGMMFGLWPSVLLSLMGIILGSMLAFTIGKVFGVKLVKWIAGESMLEKYKNIAEGRDIVLLFFMFLLPMFPDDIICLIAGLTTLSYSKFLLIQLITRPLGTIGVAALGDGALSIPFSGYGILAWLFIGIMIFGTMFVVWKYNTRITRWIKDRVAISKRKKFGYGNIDESQIDETIKENVLNCDIIRVNDYFYKEPKIILQHMKRHEKEERRALKKKLKGE